MKKKKRSNDSEVALKLDINKTYDRIEWAYLKVRMKRMGFYCKWIEWIMMCVMTVPYEFCSNDSSIGPITSSRGLRQRYLLSSLFVFSVEGLSSSLNKNTVEGHVHGSQICPDAPFVMHLWFTDDNFLFFRADTGETTNIKNLLNDNERLSRQSENFQKSCVFYSANISQVKRVEFSGVPGVHNNL